MRYVKQIVQSFFITTGKPIDEKKHLGQYPIQLIRVGENIENCYRLAQKTKHLVQQGLVGSSVFGGKRNKDFWQSIFESGKTPDGQEVMPQGINVMDMIKPQRIGGRRMTKLTQSQLESYLWGAATLLRGYIDAGDYKQFIFPLLFFKRMCDVYDEEYALALEESGGDEDYASFDENHRFQIPEDAHWNKVREVGKNVGKAIQDAMRKIESANTDKLYGIFGDAQWTNKDRLPDRTLKELIEHFSSQTLSIANCPEDELGVGYEYLIKKFADDSGHTAAEFYTNRTVVHLMTELLQTETGRVDLRSHLRQRRHAAVLPSRICSVRRKSGGTCGCTGRSGT